MSANTNNVTPMPGVAAFDALKSAVDKARTELRGTITEQIPVDLIDADPRQFRKDFEDSENTLEGLATNIKEVGLLEPIHVRRHPDSEGRYILLSGERRLRAVKRLKWDRIVATVFDDERVSTDLDQLWAAISTNLQRKNLTLLEHFGFVKALTDLGLTQNAIAAKLGKHKTWVSKVLALEDLEGPAKHALDEGFLDSPEAARLMKQLPVGHQRALLRDARNLHAPIGRMQIQKRLDAGPKTGRPAAPETSIDESAPAALPTAPASASILLPPLSLPQAHALFRALAAELPSDQSEIGPALLRLLDSYAR